MCRLGDQSPSVRRQLEAFYMATDDIGLDSDLKINGMLGIATEEDDNFTIDCVFSRRLTIEDFGTVMGTLLGTQAVQHNWSPEQISGALMRMIASRDQSGTVPKADSDEKGSSD
ncbi:MAG: hypothetical protein HDQ87_05375 [Clostridia bacterium]|nr:hypothetical protein [Clostridia bacterium]